MRAQRPALAKRYAIHLPLDLGDVIERYVGTDVSTGQTVVVTLAQPDMARLVSSGVGATHRHVAGLLDAVEAPPADAFPFEGERTWTATALVAQLVRGRSLAEVIRSAPLNPDRAVAWTIRILEGLQVLHQRHVPHGALSSHSIIAEPKERPIAPVISQLIVPALKDYASPERLTGSGPTPADDLWAVGLLLFEMLTGRLPFGAAGATWGRCELTAKDSEFLSSLPQGNDLDTLVRRILSVDASRRPASTEELLDLFDRWEQRVELPAASATTQAHPASSAKAGHPAPWDSLVQEFEGGGKRLGATLDAAEQMRQSVLSNGQSPGNSSVQARDSSVDRAVHASQPSMPAPARRKTPSFGPEMAAFRQRSRPKNTKWFIGLGLLVIAIVATALLLGRREDWSQLAAASSALPALEPGPPVGVLSSIGGATNPVVNEPSRRSARQEQIECIRSYYRPDSLAEGVDLGFVCTEQDFLVVNRRLHEEESPVGTASTVPSGSSSASAAVEEAAAAGTSGSASSANGGNKEAAPTAPTMVIRSGAMTRGWQLGWYELVATAIIRQNCCREAAPIKLPQTTGWCQQLQNVVRRIAADSVKVGDISPGVRSFDETVTCLVAQGRHYTIYPYKGVPTSLQKNSFQQFLKHAAEADARRTSHR